MMGRLWSFVRGSRKCPLAGGADGRSLIAIDQAPRPPNEGAARKKNEARAFAAGQPVPTAIASHAFPELLGQCARQPQCPRNSALMY